jgi:hypothetical protein
MAVTTVNERRVSRHAPRLFVSRIRRSLSAATAIGARGAKEALRVALVIACMTLILGVQAGIYIYLWRLPL